MAVEPAAAPLSLRASGRVRRRKRLNRTMEVGASLAAALAVAVLAAVVASVFVKGLPALTWDLFTKNQATFGESGGGIANAIVGSAVIVGIAAAMALPFGVLIAIYVSEFARPSFARLVRTTLDVMNGLPSIVIGLFVFTALVLGGQQSAFAGSVAIGVIMVPLVSRATQEVLALVPTSLREASHALGVSKWRTTLGVVLPTSFSGILTGATLAIARGAGETAPLLFTTSIFINETSVDPRQALNSLPLTIFIYSEQPDPALQEQAWAAAFILIVFVLVTSLLSRMFLARSRRKLEQT
jgi:phosphate transport system permease protein